MALCRFHLATGAKVAARWLAPLIGLSVGAVAFLGPDFVLNLARSLFPEDGPLMARAAVVGLVMTSVVGFTSRQVTPATRGVLLSLPATENERRRSLCLVVTASLFPLWLVFWLLILLGPASLSTKGLYGLSIPLLTLSLVYGWLPMAKRWQAVLVTSAAGVAAFSALVAGWGLFLAVATIVGLETLLVLGRFHLKTVPKGRAVTEIKSVDKQSSRGSRLGRGSQARPVAYGVLLRLRALGWQVLFSSFGPLLFLGMGWLFLRNNRLSMDQAELAQRLALGLAATALAAALVSALQKTWRPWLWFRSLPLSAGLRILPEVLVLALPIVGLVALLLVTQMTSLAPLAEGSPALGLLTATALTLAGFLSIRGVWLLRGSRRMAAGHLGLEGGLLAGLLALLPWLAIAGPVICFLAWRQACESDRRWSVSKFDELEEIES